MLLLPARDGQLVQILDAALSEAARRSGEWLVCRPGCTHCCLGPFPITALDASRLQAGMAELAGRDGERAARVRQRALDTVARYRETYGPAESILEHLDEVDDDPCPALDPETGTCDLYAARPVTCRVFGPAMPTDGGALGVCELCYQGATDAEIAACSVTPDPEGLEAELLAQLDCEEETIVALALLKDECPAR